MCRLLPSIRFFLTAAACHGCGHISCALTVWVHEYPDGRLAIFHGPHRLADYDPRERCGTMLNWLPEPFLC